MDRACTFLMRPSCKDHQDGSLVAVRCNDVQVSAGNPKSESGLFLRRCHSAQSFCWEMDAVCFTHSMKSLTHGSREARSKNALHNQNWLALSTQL
mmetsp:Transcript_1545/g.9512  ORF Transcript_1545/g.9512 Transcript_1545/m.9512 type:complete len:95 (-) Transcript_1545:639-923(-)